MNSTSIDNLSIESLGAYSQPANGNSLGSSLDCSAPASNGGRKAIQVPRRLNDAVRFSQECKAEESGADDLCANFMAAWG